eukprot:gb/GFBE01067671.1/.p1 GENE.gb/GFBE01067671.1/~~gb/GFBE01067671.1/.p1  ORF type:complete len:448 (+),score=77.94 gb/GFBE01067671.1/:1-1344(+)
MSMYSRDGRDSGRQEPMARTPGRDFARNSMLRQPRDMKPFAGASAAAPSKARFRTTSLERSPVTAFLREIGLPQYADLMQRSGFDDMETLLEIEDEHMRELGLPPGHIVKLKKRLREYDGKPVRGGSVLEAARAPQPTLAAAQPAVPRAPKGNPKAAAQPSTAMMTTVQRSWHLVKETGTDVVGEMFYKKFFELEPEAKELFPVSVRMRYRDWASDGNEDESDLYNSGGMRKLWAKVIDAIGSAVAGLHDVTKLVPMLHQLGMRHVGYGLKPEYFQVAEKVMVMVLKEGLGDQFTTEIENAWVMVYGFMSATMLAGYNEMRAKIQASQSKLQLQGIARSVGESRTELMTPSSAAASVKSTRSSTGGQATIVEGSFAEQMGMPPRLAEEEEPVMTSCSQEEHNRFLMEAASSSLDQLPLLLNSLQRQLNVVADKTGSFEMPAATLYGD